VAVYLKSAVVMPHPETLLARVAYPPVDSILLRNISRVREIEAPNQKDWGKIRWTQLNEASYYDLMNQLRKTLNRSEPFWKLERFWTVADETD